MDAMKLRLCSQLMAKLPEVASTDGTEMDNYFRVLATACHHCHHFSKSGERRQFIKAHFCRQWWQASPVCPPPPEEITMIAVWHRSGRHHVLVANGQLLGMVMATRSQEVWRLVTYRGCIARLSAPEVFTDVSTARHRIEAMVEQILIDFAPTQQRGKGG